MSSSECSVDSDDLLPVIILLAQQNTRSLRILVPGTHKYFLPSTAKVK